MRDAIQRIANRHESWFRRNAAIELFTSFIVHLPGLPTKVFASRWIARTFMSSFETDQFTFNRQRASRKTPKIDENR